MFYFSVFFISPHEQNGVHRPSSTFSRRSYPHRLLQMLLMCFGICPLIESVSGFGIGFMVAAPIFLSLGYKPFQAVLLSFIGLLASSWGQWQLVRLSVPSSSICRLQHGTNTALLSIPMFAYFVILSLHVVGGWQAVIEKWKEGFGFFLLFSLESIFLTHT